MAARAAGAVALRYWKGDYAIRDKGLGEGPVTEADLAVDRCLSDILRAARPDYGWLSEESAEHDARGATWRIFVVDPIDGTRAFIAGEESFAISLAVVEDGRVVTGVVYLPARDRLYAAVAGGIATRDGQPVLASAQAGVPGARILTSRANLRPEEWPGGVPDLRTGFRPSLAYRLCLVAEGRYDGMLMLRPTWDWDIAAGALIAERAGAVVTDGAGQGLVFNGSDPRNAGVIAAAPGLHADLMRHRLGPSASGETRKDGAG
ncbi:3'(2'),5'-bisphosphate nucleotidase CysQ [Szabonella alba]|uniref:3'(2'),5'-bisphosphate nucleotidase CysQ n=1 Tax=Szabonella alba TaxID=2804194 RepID=A0A8K0V5Y1_9RHOB|nr:3'(2'),5'-bisphosphate nucleotidase CysQ [Szabonella alba]MBL4915776.1 3'(2'),5'-bisphosphate nucleotidase CysQ [Szabonella alba]